VGEAKVVPTDAVPTGGGLKPGTAGGGVKPVGGISPPPAVKPRVYHGSASISPMLARTELDTIAQEVIALRAGDPTATVRFSVEITAEFADGASDTIKRAVSANADTLGFKSSVWES